MNDLEAEWVDILRMELNCICAEAPVQELWSYGAHGVIPKLSANENFVQSPLH